MGPLSHKPATWPTLILPAHSPRHPPFKTISLTPFSHSILPLSLSSFSSTIGADIATVKMQPSSEDTTDDPDNLSFTSTTTNSGSETTWTTSSNPSSSSTAKTHHSALPCKDPCWLAIKKATSATNPLTLNDLRFVHRLGSGDIGSVYLVQLKNNNGGSGNASGCFFAAKVMDKKELVSRNKETRARIEREILEMLDHPFLPTLYATLDCPRWSCLLTEFCPGGDLHVLRQRQPDKRFHESAVR